MKWMTEEYCFINVGRVAGKVKFCMLNKCDSWISENYSLRAALHTDAGGQLLIAVEATECEEDIMKTTEKNQTEKLTVQQLVWSCHHRIDLEAASLLTIYHINGNTMDNRHTNLSLNPIKGAIDVETARDSLIYWNCVEQLVYELPWLNIPDVLYSEELSQHEKTPYTCTSNEQVLYECHYLPCVKLESRQLQYKSCGRCATVRYCSLECQQLDWPVHKLHCDLIHSVITQQQSVIRAAECNLHTQTSKQTPPIQQIQNSYNITKSAPKLGLTQARYNNNTRSSLYDMSVYDVDR